MKREIIEAAAIVVVFVGGLILGTICTRDVKSNQTAINPCVSQIADEQNNRPKVIAQFVQQWNIAKGEYNSLRQFEKKDADSFGGEIQALYRMCEKFANLRQTLEVNQFIPTEVGVEHQELRRIEALTYRRTLDAVYELQKMGGTNRCLFEGGCMNDAEEIRRIDSHLTVQVLNLE